MKHFKLIFSLCFGIVLVVSACGSDPEPEQEAVVWFTHATPVGGSPIRVDSGGSILGEPIHLHFVGVPKDLRIQRVIPPRFTEDVPFRIEGPRNFPAVRVLGPFSLVRPVLDLRVTWSTGATRIRYVLVNF